MNCLLQQAKNNEYDENKENIKDEVEGDRGKKVEGDEKRTLKELKKKEEKCLMFSRLLSLTTSVLL